MITTPILQPGQVEAPAGDIPALFLPAADLFARRSRRFGHLAPGHGLADYLLFLARLAEWQQQELDRPTDLDLPDVHLLAQCREHAMPPLAPAGWPRHPSWRDAVFRAVEAVAHLLPAKGRQALTPLLHGDFAWLDIQAHTLLNGPAAELDLASAPFIGATLQAQWTRLARGLQPEQLGRPEHPAICPVCGSPPVASVIRAEASARGLRYLHCALCGSEWHVVRAKCVQCDNTREIGYYGLENAHPAVRAEACSECRCYLKVLVREHDASVDPVADDIATLTLDLLMDEKQKYACIGTNFFMM
ncbi:formate dehydrogenase accessory protein FdhE [Desulfobulbus sp.]|uniref:formate dehydrogenase accessory protein FdhE n=1 Tax=Desulfobulbus sp. TaxID=895 RepID=UPI00286F886C|nr:formate dehydrogenase accessory protein FdhE [Desulfobulbus sp.]